MKIRIAYEDAQRAIYLDFEGVMDAAPVMLGAHWLDDAQQGAPGAVRV